MSPWKILQEFLHSSLLTTPWLCTHSPRTNSTSASPKALCEYRGGYLKFYQVTKDIQHTQAVPLLIKVRKNWNHHRPLVLLLNLPNLSQTAEKGICFTWVRMVHQPYSEAKSLTSPESPIHLVLQIRTLNFNLSTIYKNAYRHKRA